LRQIAAKVAVVRKAAEKGEKSRGGLVDMVRNFRH